MGEFILKGEKALDLINRLTSNDVAKLVDGQVQYSCIPNETGGIVEKEMPLHISNVALFNPQTQKADRVGIKSLEDGRKVRFFKSNGEVVDA